MTEPQIEEINLHTTLGYIKSHYYKQALILISLNLLMAGLMYYFKIELLLQILIALDIFAFAYVYSLMRRAFIESFAKANGYTYEPTGNISEFIAPYLKAGHSQGISNILRGKYLGMPIVLFEFSTEIGYGKSKRYVNFTVFEITYKTDLEHIFLERKGWFWGNGLTLEKKPGRELNLEGDFNKYFTLYVPEDYEIESLQIFTPEIMAHFIDHGKGFSFELIDNKLFIYAHKIINKRIELERLYNFAKHLVTTLAPRLERII